MRRKLIPTPKGTLHHRREVMRRSATKTWVTRCIDESSVSLRRTGGYTRIHQVEAARRQRPDFLAVIELVGRKEVTDEATAPARGCVQKARLRGGSGFLTRLRPRRQRLLARPWPRRQRLLTRPWRGDNGSDEPWPRKTIEELRRKRPWTRSRRKTRHSKRPQTA